MQSRSNEKVASNVGGFFFQSVAHRPGERPICLRYIPDAQVLENIASLRTLFVLNCNFPADHYFRSCSSPFSLYAVNNTHKKPELMSPAGYWPQLYAAIEAGADAVYFGLNHFSARAKVGFSIDELPK